MKLKKYVLLLISLLTFCSSRLYSQSIANYTTARTTGITYSSINGTGNAIDSWRYAVGGGFSQDDNRSNQTDIGFDFWYNGTRYTRFSVSTNGYVDFSSSASDGGPDGGPYSYDNNAFTSNGSGTWLALAPFYDDMTAQGGTDALGNSIKYLVSGTAPNRVLTIEWINMAVYQNTSPSLNFQVKLHETTGVIEFIYGTMTQGTNTFSYTCGINAATLNNTPTAAQLKTQQTANSNTFNNTQQNGLVTLPASNSRITFTPPLTTPAPSGSVTFSGVSQTGMTVNWPNWCSNEVGYVVYSSTDNVNFDFAAQTAANATSYAATGLLPSTQYYWKVYAVTEGALSTALSGSQSTLAAGNVISVRTGNWNATNTWNCGCIPTAADNVTIANTHTVTLNTNGVCNTLTVGQGSSGILRLGNNGTSRSLTVNSDITIKSGATMDVSTSSNTSHTLSAGGDISNSGTLNFAPDANSFCNVTFTRNGNQTISGSASTNNFHFVTLSMGTSINNTLNVTSTNFTAATGFLTLNSGMFKLSTTGTVAITPYSANATIPLGAGITVNSNTATVTFGGGIDLFGSLIVNSGAVNIGNANNENVASDGGVFQISGGTVKIAGCYYSADINTLAKFTISGGTLTLPTSGSTSTTIAPFQIDGVGSTFNMSGGSIIIERKGGGTSNLGYTVTGVTNSAVTGGTLQIGDGTTPASQTININSSCRVGNLLVNSANATAMLNTNSLQVTQNITIASGTLNANNLNFTLEGNWINNSTFTPGTGTVIFDGTSGQSIGGSVATAFRGLKISDGSGVTLALNTSVAGTLTFTAGVINTGANKVTITSTGSVTGAGAAKFVNGFLEKNVATGTNVTRNYEIGYGATDYLPVSLTFANVSTAGNITARVYNLDHPNISTSCIDPAKSVNRYWQLSNTGTVFTTFSPVCTFIGVGSDADAGSTTGNYYVADYNGSTWTTLGAGTATATSTQGTGATAIGALQVGERKGPTITTQPVSTAVCNTSPASFTVAGTAVSGYQWQVNTGSGFTNLANGGVYSGVTTATLNISSATTAMNGYLYRCILTGSACGGTTTSGSATLTVNPSVTAGVSISASPSNNVCSGTTVTFTATPVNGGTTPAYQWKVNGVNVGTNSPSYSSAALATGNVVTCVLTSNATCVTGSPATSNSITMTVNPALPASVSIAASSTTICPGTNVTFTATPVNGGTTPAYQWKVNGTNVGTSAATYSSTTLVNGDVVTCVMTSNASPCLTGSPATSNSITITVNPALPVSVSIAASPSSTICAGTSVTFTATPVNGGTTPSYQWKLNGVNVGTNSPTYINAALTNGNTVSCIMTSTATCGTGSPATSNTITMTVSLNLPVSVSIAASPAGAVCAGTTVTFTATPVNGGTTPSYQWKVNGVNVGTNAPSYSSTTLNNSDAVTCVLTSNATCATGNPATSNTITMSVNPNLPVSVSIAASPSSTVCAGTSVTFTATPVNGGTTPSYQWKLNGGNVGINAAAYTTSALNSGDVITCVLTSNATCATGSPATSNAVTMTVNPNLPVSVSIAASPAGAVCSGTNVTFTAMPVNGGTAPSYQWKVNGVNAGTGLATYSSTSLANGDVVTCVLTSNATCATGNPATSNAITETITAAGSWLGAVSTDWNDAGNWCGGVPSVSTDVVITAGTPFAPALSAAADCRNISIAAGTNVSLNGNTLNVYGAFSGTGTIKGSLSAVLNIVGSGTAGTFYMDQTVAGISNNLADITLNRSGITLTAGNTINVTGTVGINAGTFDAGNNLTLVSNAAGTARVAQLAGGADITGNVTMQRYIPGGTDGWMFLCAPVSGATLQQWDDDFITGGFPGSQYPTSVTNASINGYDETLPGTYDDGYTIPANITDPIVPRAGYWAYILNTPVTVDVTGPLLKNQQVFPVTYTNDPTQPASENGWNLLANPYPSTIDWDAAGWTKTNINDAIYMYSPTLDQYTSYVGGIGTNGGSNLIASSQAFLVQTNAPGPVLKLQESAKDASDGLFIRSSAPAMTDDLIKLDLSNGSYTDETVIHFNNAATAGFDLPFDAMKFFSFDPDVPGIATMLDTTKMSVNTYPALTSDLAIPVKVKVGISGTYTIRVDSITRLPEGACVIMQDLLTGVNTDLRTTTSYSFYISDTTSFPRFVINIGAPVQTAAVPAQCSNTSNGMAVAIGQGTGPWDYTWQDAGGAVIQSHTGIAGADTLDHLAAGDYTVTVNGNGGFCGTLSGTVHISSGDSIAVDAAVVNAGCSGAADGAISIVSVTGGHTPYVYSWSNGITTPENTGITAGTYTLSVSDSAGCVQQEQITVPQNSALTAGFTMSTDTVFLHANAPVVYTNTSSGATSFAWDFGDGSAISTASDPSYLYKLPGTYTVTMIVSDGMCTDTVTQTIVVMPYYNNHGTSTGIAEANHGGDQIMVGTQGSQVDLIFNLDKSCEVVIDVYNSIAQQVFDRQAATVHKGKVTLNFEDKDKGIYYIRISSADGLNVVKKVLRS